MGCDHKHVLKDYVLRSILSDYFYFNKCWNDTEFMCNEKIRLRTMAYIKLTKIDGFFRYSPYLDKICSVNLLRQFILHVS